MEEIVPGPPSTPDFSRVHPETLKATLVAFREPQTAQQPKSPERRAFLRLSAAVLAASLIPAGTQKALEYISKMPASPPPERPEENKVTATDEDNTPKKPVAGEEKNKPAAQVEEKETLPDKFVEKLTIGESVKNQPIEVFKLGKGNIKLVAIGGLHTGDEENTQLLAQETLDYFTENPSELPPQISLYILPVANPDGAAAGSHFNANMVDLNRNFPTEDWEREAFHPPHGKVSAGEQPLSEPETEALYRFLEKLNPHFVISWHSQAKIVEPNHAAMSDKLAQIYAQNSGYKLIDKWPFYKITGDFIASMKDLGIAACDVELSSHGSSDFDRNLTALKAVTDACCSAFA